MFGVGYSEMMVLALAALLIFGPGKMPEVMSQAGKWVRQFREMTAEYSGEFNKTMAEAKGVMDEFQKELGPMQKQVDSMKRDLGVKTPAKPVAASSSSTAAKTTTGTATSKSTAKSSTSTNRSTSTTTSKTTTAAKSTTSPAASVTKPPVAETATKENPVASMSLYEPAERPARRRSRSATPSVIRDLTPRASSADSATVDSGSSDVSAVVADDALDRARARRHAADARLVRV